MRLFLWHSSILFLFWQNAPISNWMNCLVLVSSGSSPSPTTGSNRESIHFTLLKTLSLTDYVLLFCSSYFILPRSSTLKFSVEICIIALSNILPLWAEKKKMTKVAYYIIFCVYHYLYLLYVNIFVTLCFWLCLTYRALISIQISGQKSSLVCVIGIIFWIYASVNSLLTFFCHCSKAF